MLYFIIIVLLLLVIFVQYWHNVKHVSLLSSIDQSMQILVKRLKL